ncbi:hypothetical protein [Coralloluteibacterium thermophilus]|uniref:Phage portal protein n=1 Tax=Coralloluteibacterium thermophilum TaxID=2707049 RepID=A0ABV9NKJ3_9GAMM
MTDDALAQALRQFEEAYDQTQNERAAAERDRDYYDGRQITAEEEEVLRKRKQPVVIYNRIKPKINSLLGFERRQRTDPKAFPRTPQHDKDAEAVTDALRFVCDQNQWQKLRSDVAEDMFIEGIGACTVTVAQKADGQFDVKLTRVPWDRFYRDPHSRARDFSDANFLGVVLWMDEKDALALYPGKEDVIKSAYTTGETDGNTYDDRPKLNWSDDKRKRIRVLQHRWREDGKWMTATLCRGGYLRDPQPSPYLDEDGAPACDLLAVSAYVTRENERYGEVRNMISAQDEINKRRSKALHRLSVNQFIYERGAVADVAATKRALAEPDGAIEVTPDMRFELRDNATLAQMQGELQMLQEAKAEIDASGVNPALQGDVQAPSGRAVEALQIAGLQEHATAFDSLRDWSWRVYRAIWCRIRQYWTEERWIRVTDNENNLRWVGLNRQATQAELVIEQARQQGRELTDEQIAMLQADPRFQEVVTQNDLAELDVDIIVEDGPDSVTIQSEQFEQLVELKKADPSAIPTAMVIEASSLRNKDQILEHLESGGIPLQVQQQMQEMQQALQEAQQQVQQAEQKAQSAQGEQQIKAAELDLRRMELQIEAQKLEIERFRAETDRMQAMRPPDPPQVPLVQ